ncbi:DUF1674 domain-containing protein [Zhengella sp. ZM62]|uniref:DUF1674 domain-containing protein n=1 Tax=Zhengella sedimenti TaxID=3390035 RepID=UPI003974ABB2
MTDHRTDAAQAGGTNDEADDGGPKRRRFEDLPPAAQRALREAEERREAYEAAERARPKELGGRGGKEPVRYGDWEIKGLAIDF